jgi:hypothetical protein
VHDGAASDSTLMLTFVKLIVDHKQALFRELVYDGLSVDAIHADRTPEQRAQVIARFRSGVYQYIYIYIYISLLSSSSSSATTFSIVHGIEPTYF